MTRSGAVLTAKLAKGTHAALLGRDVARHVTLLAMESGWMDLQSLGANGSTPVSGLAADIKEVLDPSIRMPRVLALAA